MSKYDPQTLTFAPGDTLPVDLVNLPFAIQNFSIDPADVSYDVLTSELADSPDVVGGPQTNMLEMVAKIRIIATNDNMATALGHLHALAMKLENIAERDQPGMPIDFQPKGASQKSRLYALAGYIEGLPMASSGEDVGFFYGSPVVTLRVLCRPYFYGQSFTANIGSAFYVPGDVDAEASFAIKAAAPTADLIWGVARDGYDGTQLDATWKDIKQGAGLTGGTSAVVAGSRSTNCITNKLTTETSTVGQFTLAKRGRFRVLVRLSVTSELASVRLAYRSGDSGVRVNDWVPINQGVMESATPRFMVLDLGPIESLPPVIAGATYDVRCMIQAKSTRADGTLDTISLDFVDVFPGDRTGRLQTPMNTYERLSLGGSDSFNQTSGNIVGKTTDDGKTWATPSWTLTPSTNDFTVDTTNKLLQRTAVSDVDANKGRWIYLSNALASPEVYARIPLVSLVANDVRGVWMGNDGSSLSQALLFCMEVQSATSLNFRIKTMYGNTPTVVQRSRLVNFSSASITSSWYVDMHLRANDANGGGGWAFADVTIYDGSGNVMATYTFKTTYILPFGSTTAISGKCGVYDCRTSATAGTRQYDLFRCYETVPAAPVNPVTVAASPVTVTSYDATRVEFNGRPGRPARITGSQLLIPPSTDQQLPVVVRALGSPENMDEQPSQTGSNMYTEVTSVASTLTVTPRYRTPLP